MQPDFRTGGAMAGALAARLLTDALPDLPPGTRVGPFVVESILGRGGMSDVYLARRDSTAFEQHVALKVVAHRPDLLERFREERRTLARLQHPAIAAIIDGGEFDDGRAWFAMEYIDGAKLDEHLQARVRDWREALLLIDTLCAAVAHAHAHLLVHRDIKPANAMVDREGHVRLLDFGIALPLDFTDASGDRLMTPGFAAPEQLGGGTITTATDIYQLGVTLRVLFADDAPYALPTLLRRDFDAVVATATATQPELRHASVAELREDLAALRAFTPVRSRRIGLGHRLALLVRRHPFAAPALASLIGAVFVSLFLLAQSQIRESREREAALREEQTASAVSQFFIGLFNEPNDAQGVAQLLDRGQQRLLARTQETSATHAALLHALARANVQMERPDAARPLLDAAIKTQRALGNEAGDDLALSLAALARVEFNGGDTDAGTALALEATNVLAHSQGARSHSRFLALTELGEFELDALRFASARRLLDEARSLGERRYGSDGLQLFRVDQLLAAIPRYRWEVDTALPLTERLVATCRTRMAPDAPECIVETTNHARTLALSGRTTEAEQIFRGLLADAPEWQGKQRGYREHAALFDLSETLWLQGRFAEARTTLEASLALLAEAQGNASGPHWESDRGALALLLNDMGDSAQALAISSEFPRGAWPNPEARMEDHFWIVRQATFEAARHAIAADTTSRLEQAVKAMVETYGDRSYFAARARIAQARVQLATNDTDAARATLERADTLIQQGLAMPYAQQKRDIAWLRAEMAAREDDSVAHVAALQAAVDALSPYADADHPFRIEAELRLALAREAPDVAVVEAWTKALAKHHLPTSPVLVAARAWLDEQSRGSTQADDRLHSPR